MLSLSIRLMRPDKKRNEGWGQWRKNKYEDDYFKSVYKTKQDLNQDSVFTRYLDIEATNDRLMKLKHKFGDDQTSQHHMKSIYQSRTYDFVKPKKETDPRYNLVKNVIEYDIGSVLQ